jgi:lipooligosaccharide transport system permease protein
LLRALESHALNYRRTWRGSVFSSILSPILFLTALGLGLGSLVDRNTSANGVGGVAYLAFLAPGLLAAGAMQTGASEATYPVIAGIKWLKTYHAQLATPLSVDDVALGQLLWVGVRLVLNSTIFLVVIVAFGGAESPGIVLAVPAAVLTGLAFAGPIAGYTASLETEYGISSLMRFGILPLFLFSGTFFPVEQIPHVLQPVVYIAPLWHGVDLCRSLALGTAEMGRSLAQAAYLSLWALAGAALTVSRFRKALVV